MLSTLALTFALAPINTGQAQSFDAFAAAYRAAKPASARSAVVDDYVSAHSLHRGFPVIEPDGSVVFFYRGNGKERSVAVVGEFRRPSFYTVDWDPRGEPMTRLIEDGEIFFAKIKAEPDARIEYQFVVDGEKKVDPLNSRRVFNGVANGEASELVMPSHPSFAGDPPAPAYSAKGKIEPIQTDWAKTAIEVYLPPGYDPSKRYPVIYTADGSAWHKYLSLPATLDRMISEHRIEPVIAVMIDPIEDRRSWYLFNPEYLKYLEEIVHFIDGHYSTRANPAGRLHAGTSAGGRASLFAGLERPKLFQNVALLSPSLNGSLAYFEPYFSKRKHPNRELRVWISAGSYEGSLEEDARVVERWLRSAGLTVASMYTHEGHSFRAWQHRAEPMLAFFFSTRRTRR